MPDDCRMFQIYEADLAELERTMPKLCESLGEHLDAKMRTQFRRLQSILSQVRWNYGPPENVERVDD